MAAGGAAGIIGNLRIIVDADTSKAQAAMRKMGGYAATVGTTIGAGLGLAAVAALRMGDTYDAAMDSIRIGTGATGDSLNGLTEDFKAVSGRVTDDVRVIGQVLADLNTRTGQTGDGLRDLTENVLDLSRMTGGDAVANVARLTRLYGDWSIAAENQIATNDSLLRVSQATGATIESLADAVVQYGAPLRGLGVDLETSISLLGKWEKEGVNVETMLQGMRMAVKTFAAQGLDPTEAFPAFVESLKEMDEATGLLTARQIVGGRAFNDFYRAAVEGRFDVEDLVATYREGADTVKGLADETRDAGDIFKELGNIITVHLGSITAPLAGIAASMGNAIFLLPALGGALGNALGRMWTRAAKTRAGLAAAAAAGKVAGLAYTAASFVVGKFMQAAAALWAMMGGGRILALAAAAGTKAGAAYGAAVALAAKAAAIGGAIWAAAGTAAGAIMGSAVVAAVLPIASLALTAVAVKMGADLAGNIGKWQAEVQKGADAAVNQTATDAIANLENLTKHMHEVQGLGRILGDTFGGEQEASGLLNLAKAIRDDTTMTATEIVKAGAVLAAAAHEAGARGNQAVEQEILAIAALVSNRTPVLESAISTYADAFTRMDFAPPDVAGPIRAEFKLATKAVARGFGSVKQALANPPQMISKDDRLTNMAARMKKVMANIKKATEVGDPMAQRYWEKARLKQQMQMNKLRGKTTSTLGEVKAAYQTAGVKVGQVWETAKTKTTNAARTGATNAIRETERVPTAVENMNLTTAGVNLMNTWAAGIRAGIGSAVAAATAAAAAVAAVTVGTSPPPKGPLHDIDKGGRNVMDAWLGGFDPKRAGKVGARLAAAVAPGLSAPRLALAGAGAGAAGGGQVHFHIGTLIADDKGLDELDRRMSRRQTVRNRGPMRYQQK